MDGKWAWPYRLIKIILKLSKTHHLISSTVLPYKANTVSDSQAVPGGRSIILDEYNRLMFRMAYQMIINSYQTKLIKTMY